MAGDNQEGAMRFNLLLCTHPLFAFNYNVRDYAAPFGATITADAKYLLALTICGLTKIFH
jgi:hypothetical protein